MAGNVTRCLRPPTQGPARSAPSPLAFLAELNKIARGGECLDAYTPQPVRVEGVVTHPLLISSRGGESAFDD